MVGLLVRDDVGDDDYDGLLRRGHARALGGCCEAQRLLARQPSVDGLGCESPGSDVAGIDWRERDYSQGERRE